jgi:hypothetical protein
LNLLLTFVLLHTQNPPKKSGPFKRFIFRKIGLGFIIAREDMSAKDHAHEAYPSFEEISDEEWMRRATPLHYPYHTAASKKAYDEEMVIRERMRAKRWADKFAFYAERKDNYKRKVAAERFAASIFSSSDSDSGSSVFSESSDDKFFVHLPSILSSMHKDYIMKLMRERSIKLSAWEDEGGDSTDTEYKRELKIFLQMAKTVMGRCKANQAESGLLSLEDPEDSPDSEEFVGSDDSTKVGSDSTKSGSDSTMVDSDSTKSGSDCDSGSDSESDYSSVESVEWHGSEEPNWGIKLDFDSDPNLGFLDFDNDPFLSSADEKYLDDVQSCFNIRNVRVLEEAQARLFHPATKEGSLEYERLEKLCKKLVDAIETGLESIRADNAQADEPEGDDDTQVNDDEGSDKPENKGTKNDKSGDNGTDDGNPEAPGWVRAVSKKPRLVIEGPDMDVNPRRIGLVIMTDAEEKEYFSQIDAHHEMEVEFSRTERERRASVAQEIQEHSKVISWLRTREREEFPISPRVSPSSQTASSPIAAQDDLILPTGQLHRETSLVQQTGMRVYDGENLKCFSAGPHRCRDHESSETGTATALDKKKSRIGRAFKKFSKKFEKKLD